MTICKIEGFVYYCDSCGRDHRAEGMTGHYTQSTPPNWMTLDWYVALPENETFRGRKLLCSVCCDDVLRELRRIK